MRRIILLLALLCVIFSFMNVSTRVAVADGGLYNGLTSDGYVFRDGLWYQGQQAFVRTKKAFTFYDGYRQCRTYRYVYEPAPQQLQGEPIEGWRKELLELKSSRDKWESDLRASQEEQKEFLETVKALGLEDYYSTDTGYPSPLTAPQPQVQPQTGYGQLDAYALEGKTTTYSAPLAAQGDTLFGYDQYAQAYPDVELRVLYNQANSLAESAQDLASNATSDFAALVHQESQNQENVASILAKGQVAAQVLQMLQEQNEEVRVEEWKLRRQSKSEGGNWEIVPAEPPEAEQPSQPPPPPQDEAGLDDQAKRALFGMITQRCVQCHGPEKQKAGLNMTKFLSFKPGKQKQIVQTLITDDPDMRMPKAADGGPGEPLSAAEIDLFFAAAGLRREEVSIPAGKE